MFTTHNYFREKVLIYFLKQNYSGVLGETTVLGGSIFGHSYRHCVTDTLYTVAQWAKADPLLCLQPIQQADTTYVFSLKLSRCSHFPILLWKIIFFWHGKHPLDSKGEIRETDQWSLPQNGWVCSEQQIRQQQEEFSSPFWCPKALKMGAISSLFSPPCSSIITQTSVWRMKTKEKRRFSSFTISFSYFEGNNM